MRLFIDTHSSLLSLWASRTGTLLSGAARNSQGLHAEKEGASPTAPPPPECLGQEWSRCLAASMPSRELAGVRPREMDKGAQGIALFRGNPL